MELGRLEVKGAGGGRHVVVTAGVHGDEFEPMLAVRSLATCLHATASELRGRVTLVPVANEAAFRRGCRRAEDGLDMARICPGRADGSVTERAAAAVSALIRTADAYVDLHTGGRELHVLPLAGYMLHANAAVVGVQRRMARAAGLRLVWGTDPGHEGRTLSVARDHRVPAIYMECGGGGFDRPAVDALVAACLNVLATLGVIERDVDATSAPIVIEDARPRSGYMQGSHQSPADGFFEPVMSVGDRVARGQRLGDVIDLAGGDVHPLVAEEAGLLVMLRALPSVLKGDGLAVVAPLDPVREDA